MKVKINDISSFMEDFENIFKNRLKEKTGWGRNEVYELFKKSKQEAIRNTLKNNNNNNEERNT